MTKKNYEGRLKNYEVISNSNSTFKKIKFTHKTSNTNLEIPATLFVKHIKFSNIASKPSNILLTSSVIKKNHVDALSFCPSTYSQSKEETYYDLVENQNGLNKSYLNDECYLREGVVNDEQYFTNGPLNNEGNSRENCLNQKLHLIDDSINHEYQNQEQYLVGDCVNQEQYSIEDCLDEEQNLAESSSRHEQYLIESSLNREQYLTNGYLNQELYFINNHPNHKYLNQRKYQTEGSLNQKEDLVDSHLNQEQDIIESHLNEERYLKNGPLNQEYHLMGLLRKKQYMLEDSFNEKHGVKNNVNAYNEIKNQCNIKELKSLGSNILHKKYKSSNSKRIINKSPKNIKFNSIKSYESKINANDKHCQSHLHEKMEKNTLQLQPPFYKSSKKYKSKPKTSKKYASKVKSTSIEKIQRDTNKKNTKL